MTFERIMLAIGVVALMAAFLIVALGLRTTAGALDVVDVPLDAGAGVLAEIGAADFIDFVLKLIPAVSIAVAAYFSVQGLRVWRSQLVGKRKFEVAEEALVAFERAREALRYVRSPGGWGGEGSTREKAPNESDEETRRKNIAFAPIERLNKMSETFAPLHKTQILCRFHFGPEAAKPFDVINDVRQEIWAASLFLVEAADDRTRWDDESMQDLNKQSRAVIYGGHSKDEIAPRLAAAMTRLETILQPYLR